MKLEHKTESQLHNGDIYRGYIDCVKNGIIEDYKTCSDVQHQLLLCRMSVQLYLYALSEISNDVEIHGVRYYIIEKPTIKLKKKQTNEEYIEEVYQWYYQDLERRTAIYSSSITEDNLERARIWMESVSSDIHRCREINHWPQNEMACNDFSRRCEFADVCETEASGLNYNYVLRTDYEQYEPEKGRDLEDRIVGYSTGKEFRNCPRRYYYKYERLLRPKKYVESEPLTYGKAFHGSMEICRRHGIDIAIYELRKLFNDDTRFLDDQSICRLISMTRVAYEVWIKND